MIFILRTVSRWIKWLGAFLKNTVFTKFIEEWVSRSPYVFILEIILSPSLLQMFIALFFSTTLKF
jgi:hypothetical protein